MQSQAGADPPSGPRAGPGQTTREGRFPPSLMHAAATLYHLKDETQADVARALGVSRATVSRLLTEARRLGIVRIQVVDPVDGEPLDLAERTAEALGLQRVLVAPQAHPAVLGASLAAQLGTALRSVGLRSGDILLVSSGRTVWEIGFEQLPSLPGTVVTPTVGGQDEPEAWYQTNEITRMIAERVGGRPQFLYAPAQPGPELYERLLEDPGTRRVLDQWRQATCAILGVGAPPLSRESMPGFVSRDAPWLAASAGDICTRFFDPQGVPLDFPGSEHLIATAYEDLRAIPHTIAVAVGEAKIPSLLAGARAGWFKTLVTDVATATALLGAAAGEAAPAVDSEAG
jgi:DNA-binding transcriptional regulator LsrR (DeoR family)